jgi:hypothetical protein
MGGKWVRMNGRQVYFPPFANQRFTGTPFWACTFTSMINAADIGFLGEIDRKRILKHKTAGDVIVALARKSGDPTKHQGSTTQEMVRAMDAMYEQKLNIVHDSPDLGRKRLRHGKALVAGLFYRDLPEQFRRHSPNFRDGHRLVFLGWRDGKPDPDDGFTKVLDPLANKGRDYDGEWIRWSAVTAAYWPGQQVWIAPGKFLPDATVEVVRRFSPARTFKIKAGAEIQGFMPKAAGVAKKRKFREARTGKFDALVKVGQPDDADPDRPKGRFIRIIEGPFIGMLLDPESDGLTAPINADPGPVNVEALVTEDDPIIDDLTVGDLPSDTEEREDLRTAIPEEIVEVDTDPPAEDAFDDDDDIEAG